eukprot:TRINITY_DN9684_c0_g2_i1.p1 TRINITY_DN9684_c0_g2~~TRINITY_DN9684_c0_g2_i1.p1  ORF type:complete len:153 (+),score=49.80 TRINITY_DN9684_c0_g2_i1:114-572(+)
MHAVRNSGDSDGLTLNWMSYSDEETGQELWRENWKGTDPFAQETTSVIPVDVVERAVLTRTLSFSSEFELRDLRIEQTVLVHGQQVEQWDFTFGFVIPQSTNSWTSTIKAATDMIPPEDLSGHMVIQSVFCDAAVPLATQRTRVVFAFPDKD